MNKQISVKEKKYTDSMPEAEISQLWIDFDGTITKKDTLDELIKNYSIDNSWELIEQRWQSGFIGSRQCLEEEFALLRIPKSKLHKAIENIEVDEGIFELLKIMRSHSIPVAILSDGVDIFIKQILKNNGITGMPIRSNTIAYNDPYLKLLCPHSNPKCDVGAAHCKCSSMYALGSFDKRSIYIGDGLSDYCAARHSDFIFAKGALAKRLEKENIPFCEFNDLSDVSETLVEIWGTEERSASSLKRSK